MNKNKKPEITQAQELILRCLRIGAVSTFAFSTDYIHEWINTFQERYLNNTNEISLNETILSTQTLLHSGYVYQVNNNYYRITNSGEAVINKISPLFSVLNTDAEVHHDETDTDI